MVSNFIKHPVVWAFRFWWLSLFSPDNAQRVVASLFLWINLSEWWEFGRLSDGSDDEGDGLPFDWSHYED